jgi:cytoskeleton protein RodZ
MPIKKLFWGHRSPSATLDGSALLERKAASRWPGASRWGDRDRRAQPAAATGDLKLTMQQTITPRASRVGGDLRAARERLGWSLDDTSNYVRIRLAMLQALEEGRVADLPGQAYAVGFVRSYAQALGLDAGEMVRRYHEEVGPALPPPQLDFPTPVPQRHVPAGAVVLLGAVLTIAGYVGWYRVSADHASLAEVQQVPARLAPLALPLVPPPPAHVAAAAPASVTTLARAYVPPSVSPSAAEAGVLTPGALTPIESAPIAAAPGAPQLVLNATADAWVQVKDGQGKIVLSKLMHAGDSWPVPAAPPGQPPLQLTTGNAGGTTLTLNGQALPALGGSGVVLHDIALDPQALRGGQGG